MPSVGVWARRCRAFVAWASLGLALAGCGKKNKVTEPPPESAPKADSPQNAVAKLEWCWEHLRADSYREVFTSDFKFAFHPTDPIGGNFSNREMDRGLELEIASHLFSVGSLTQPKAATISVDFGTLTVLPDSRPGKNPTWHKELVPDLLQVRIDTINQTFIISGTARIFVTRGDSAAVPGDIGIGVDETVWLVDRWEDNTAGVTPARLDGAGAELVPLHGWSPGIAPDAIHGNRGGPLDPDDTQETTLGYIKSLYRDPPLAPITRIAPGR